MLKTKDKKTIIMQPTEPSLDGYSQVSDALKSKDPSLLCPFWRY